MTAIPPPDWSVQGARKDRQSVTHDGQPFARALIDGVVAREMPNMMKGNGVLTEIFRADWFENPRPLAQVFQSIIFPGGISAWHAHALTTDQLFAACGSVHIVLYDARTHSPTFGQVNEFRVGSFRQALVIVPPGVWHGVRNFGPDNAILLNLVDRAYEYTSPDHWRLPIDTDQIPFRFEGAPRIDALSR